MDSVLQSFIIRRLFGLGDGDEDEDDAERNWGFSYGKLTQDRLEWLAGVLPEFLPFAFGEPKLRKYIMNFLGQKCI